MPKHGKKYQAAAKEIDATKTYTLEQALALVQKTSKVKFDASVEVHLLLGIDTAKGEEQVRGTVSLPHGTGKEKRVAVFADGDKAKEAEASGASKVGGKEFIDQIKADKKLDGIDVVVATPKMMPMLAPVAKILGPRGLMPSLKSDTVTENIAGVVAALKKGKVDFRNDTGGNLHQLVGKVSWDVVKLLENVKVLLEAVRKAKPAKSKGTFLRGVTVCATMGPAIKVSL